jgi:hypothetical protein
MWSNAKNAFLFLILASNILTNRVIAQSWSSYQPVSGWTFVDQTGEFEDQIPGVIVDGNVITYSSPVTADLDNNPENGLEVVSAGEDGRLYAHFANGEQFWSVSLLNAECGSSNRGNKTLSSPAIGDLNGDGQLSVVIGYGGVASKGCDGGIATYSGMNGSLEWKFSIKKFSETEKYGTRSYSVFSTPALADTDGDGKLEIGFGSFDRNVYLLEYDGSVRWYYNAADTVWSSAAFADINDDGRLEMIIGTDITGNRHIRPITKDGGYVYAFKTEKRTRTKINFRDSSAYYWQQSFDQVIYSSPVIADVISSNRGEEIIVASGCYFPERSQNKRGKWVKVLSARTGKILRTLPIDACSPSSVAVGDIDEDGALEVIASSNGHQSLGGPGNSSLVAFKPESQEILWKVTPFERGGNDGYGGNFNSPIIADFDQNGSLEVAVSNRSAISIFEGKTGNQLSCKDRVCSEDKFLAYTSSSLRSTPLVADINADGSLDLVIGGGNSQVRRRGFIYAWTGFSETLGSQPGILEPGSIAWGSARGSAARTGHYNHGDN